MPHKNHPGAAPVHTRRRFLEQLGLVGGASLVMSAMNSWDLMAAQAQARPELSGKPANSKVIILGAGVSGHTAALHLRRMLGKEHEVLVVSPNSQWNWIPSNIWVGVGRMSAADVTFALEPVYRRKKIAFTQALAVSLWPRATPRPRATWCAKRSRPWAGSRPRPSRSARSSA